MSNNKIDKELVIEEVDHYSRKKNFSNISGLHH